MVTQVISDVNLISQFADSRSFTLDIHATLPVGGGHVTGRDSPCGGCVVGQQCGAVALPSQAVSGLVVAGDGGGGLSRGLALLRHGPVPLTASLLQPAPAQTPFLQVHPAQLIVYGGVVEKVQRQQHHHEEAVDPHADQGCIITAGETDGGY